MKRGFTLIELLVSVAIFTVVMVIALGALLSISSADRKAETLKSVMSNLNFALDSMSRSIRTGVNYHCGSGGSTYPVVPLDCSGGTPANYLVFQAVNGDTVTYSLEANKANCGENAAGGCIKRRIIEEGGADSGFLQVTAPEVNVSRLDFYVLGAPTGDDIQPKVTIVVSGSVQVSASQNSAFNLQTSVTQRVYDE